MLKICPRCKPDRTLNKAGSNKSGTQRYRCRARGCGYTESEGDRIQGSLPKYGTEAQSGYDRVKRCRQKKKKKLESES